MAETRLFGAPQQETTSGKGKQEAKADFPQVVLVIVVFEVCPLLCLISSS